MPRDGSLLASMNGSMAPSMLWALIALAKGTKSSPISQMDRASCAGDQLRATGCSGRGGGGGGGTGSGLGARGVDGLPCHNEDTPAALAVAGLCSVSRPERMGMRGEIDRGDWGRLEYSDVQRGCSG